MFSPTRTALCIAVCATLGFAANEASAGCKIISGKQVCASWITGSEICQVGLDSNQLPLGLTETEFAATCSVHGVGGSEGEFFCNDANLTGTQTCGPPPDFAVSTTAGTGGNGTAWAGTNPARQGPKCDHDKFDPNKNPSCVTGSPDLGGAPLESPTVPLTCDNKGICTGTAEVEVPDGSTCSNGGELLDFTASAFIGVVVFDGPESPPETLLFQLCTLDGNGHSYTCTDITDSIDQCSCGDFSFCSD